jgi:hypothetical protein
MQVRKDWLGTRSIGRNVVKACMLKLTWYVRVVENLLKGFQTIPNFVVKNASLNGTMQKSPVLAGLINYVNIVEKNIRDLVAQNTAVKNVNGTLHMPGKNFIVLKSIRPFWFKRKTFNITVEDQHEYYANGVLVANCARILYAGMADPKYKWVEPGKQRSGLVYKWGYRDHDGGPDSWMGV